MSKNKTKIFLYAHINNIGAFNLNCRTIAKYIDKKRFEVYTLSLSSGNLDTPNFKGVKIFNCFYPAKISNYLGILWGIYNCDVAYIPGGNFYRYINFLLKLFKKPSFKRQGNLIDEKALKSFLPIIRKTENLKRVYNFHTKVLAPSKFVGEYNYKKWDLKYDSTVFMPPFMDSDSFTKKIIYNETVKDIIFIGNDMERKGIHEFLDIAFKFPELNFHIVGRDTVLDGILNQVYRKQLKNIKYHGELCPDKLNSLLVNEIDLHVFPSKSEGFGKVTIETAFCGIPSIIYGTYGAEEWLKSGDEGIIASSFDDFILYIDQLSKDKDYYSKLIKGTDDLANRFEIRKRIKVFEKVSIELTKNE
ncbi:glycosyltransferase family 4 protein [Marivirga salinae]|uniref:Glycosyltransferase family 4 protein n=1 Tax=Marivirga salinarum TaxID=3059078 RepID=A0AA49GBP8_9BACT|nr:glycosyltransferase family 4 protein [Marivirga sp. BDSF4-3]WKK74523.2 glycosyltransferase family 4 protein [Marivirga sp. BDSF4-3]